MDTAPSFLWFAAIQGIERKQDLADLAPKGCFISAEAVEREVGQIGKTQKATRELSGRIDGYRDSARETASAASDAGMNSLRGRFGNGANPKSR